LSHHKTKSQLCYMILKIIWWHVFSQRINNHQLNTNLFNDHFFSLTYSLMARCLMLICLLPFSHLYSQYSFKSLIIESTTPNTNIKLFNHTPCEVDSKQKMNSSSIVKIEVFFVVPRYNFKTNINN